MELIRQPFPMRARQRGFATLTVLMMGLVSVIGGVFLLKRMKSQAAASGGYYQDHCAALAAEAGLESAMAQLESKPTESVALLNAYLADTTRQWLLGDAGHAGARNVVKMANNLQRSAARIVAFDPVSGIIKLEGQGKGPGGSENKVHGIFKLGGLGSESLAPKYVWFIAGEARNVDMAVDVWGDTYFGGGVHFNGGADNSVLHGSLKIARGTGITSSNDANIEFQGKTYIQTPFKGQGPNIGFHGSTGFEDDLFFDVAPVWKAPGATVYFNGDVTGGHSNLDLNGNAVAHSGSLNTARITGAGSVTNAGSAIDIAGALGMDPGPEQEMSVDLSAVPASKRFTISALGIGSYGNVTGADLNAAYDAAQASGKLHMGFLFLDISSPMHFVPAPGVILRGKYVFEVTDQINANINLPTGDPASLCLFHVKGGGKIFGLGGNGLFRGYVNVSGNGSVVYQWGAGCEFMGAIHHVSPTAGFQLNASTVPLKMTFDAGVFDELAPLNILIPPGGPAPTPGVTSLKLVDSKIRLQLISRYFP